jgi:hypothetical protein
MRLVPLLAQLATNRDLENHVINQDKTLPEDDEEENP